jgi:predicted RNase H-like HicB family nuclease
MFQARSLRLDRTWFWEACVVRYRVLIEQDEDGVYIAEVPILPGCLSQGKTRSEAIDNIKEAIAGYLESLEAHGEPVPPSITEEVVEVKP